MNIEQAISRVVRHQMLTLDMKVSDLAIKAGLNVQTVSNQLNNRNSWRIERIYQFGKLLGIEGSMILDDAERLVKLSTNSKG